MTAYELPKLSGEVEPTRSSSAATRQADRILRGNKKIALVLVERGSGRTRMVQIPTARARPWCR